MHPIFATRQRLGLYLAAWTPLAALLAGLLFFIGGSRSTEALAFALPLTLVYSFLCLAAWYPCRSQPLQTTSILRAFGVHATTGLITAVGWVAMGLGLAHLGHRSGLFPGAVERVGAQAPVLLAFGFLAYLLSVLVHYLFAAFEQSREIERRALEAEVAAKTAELEMLRAQVNPHFLFNSLNSVSSLTTRDPAAARRMCVELGDFLRGALQLGRRKMIPLDEELAVIDRFLAIERCRFGDRLSVETTIEDRCRPFPVPPMLLQPLVENAVKHGIAGLLDGGLIRIAITCGDDRLRIEITNPFDPESRRERGEGLGLANVRRRLRSAYGPTATLRGGADAGVFTADIVLPAPPNSAEARSDR